MRRDLLTASFPFIPLRCKFPDQEAPELPSPQPSLLPDRPGGPDHLLCGAQEPAAPHGIASIALVLRAGGQLRPPPTRPLLMLPSLSGRRPEDSGPFRAFPEMCSGLLNVSVQRSPSWPKQMRGVRCSPASLPDHVPPRRYAESQSDNQATCHLSETRPVTFGRKKRRCRSAHEGEVSRGFMRHRGLEGHVTAPRLPSGAAWEREGGHATCDKGSRRQAQSQHLQPGSSFGHIPAAE